MSASISTVTDLFFCTGLQHAFTLDNKADREMEQQAIKTLANYY